MSFFLQLLFSGVVLGLVYALAALGFVLIYKASRVVNFAQGQFIAIGAFLAYWAMVALGAPFLLAAALALALTALLGFGVERVFLKRMVGQPIISVIMATIGLASLLDGLIHLTPFGAGNFSYPAFLPSGGVALLGVQVSYPSSSPWASPWPSSPSSPGFSSAPPWGSPCVAWPTTRWRP